MAAALVMISLIDWYTYQIPAWMNGGLMILGVAVTVLDGENFINHLIGSSLAGGILLILYYGTKKESIGGGDIKLMAACGLILGCQKIMMALFFASLLSSLTQFIRMKISHVKDKEYKFAMAPYFTLGIFVAIFLPF